MFRDSFFDLKVCRKILGDIDLKNTGDDSWRCLAGEQTVIYDCIRRSIHTRKNFNRVVFATQVIGSIKYQNIRLAVILKPIDIFDKGNDSNPSSRVRIISLERLRLKLSIHRDNKQLSPRNQYCNRS